MSQPKRLNKPIKITLTEDQIASIIERASTTRRGLKVESLEDRIAPSVIGAPLGDPMGDTGGFQNPDPNFHNPNDVGGGDPTFDAPLPLPDAGNNSDPLAGNIQPGDGSPPPGDIQPGDEPPINPEPLPPAPGDVGGDTKGGDILPPPVDPNSTPAGDPAFQARSNEMFNNYVNHQVQTTGNTPSPEEMESYRSNVLRQLRGE